MAGSISKTILIGHLGHDPSIREFDGGDKKATFSLATTEHWKDRNTGERRERTEWHKIVVRNQKLIPICENYLKKGSLVYLEGQIESHKYEDRDDIERVGYEIVVKPFGGVLCMLDTKGESDDRGGGRDDNSGRENDRPPSGGGGRPSSDERDEIPFAPEWRI